MKRALFSILFFCTITCFAQTTLPPVYEIKADTPVKKIPDAYWQMLADSTGKLKIDDVQTHQISERFHINNTQKTGIGFQGLHHYWQRLGLKNNTGKDVKLIFENSPSVDRYELYIYRSSGKVEHSVTGHFVPWSKRDGYKARNAVAVILSQQEEVTIYKKVVKLSGSGSELAIGFSFYEPFIEQWYVDKPWYTGDVRIWLIAGILIFGFFFNFFFFLIDREKVYLYMALLLLMEGIWYLTTNDNKTFREFPYFDHYFQILVTHCLFFALVTQFVRHFLKTYKYYPKWDNVLLILMTLNLGTEIVAQLFLSDIFSKSSIGYGLLANAIFFSAHMTSLLISFLFLRKERDRLTNLSVVAALPVFFLWSVGYASSRILLLILKTYYKTSPQFIQWYADNERVIEMFCIGWFAVLFTWILLQRYAMLRKQYLQQALDREREKSELINQQKAELEKKVEERTGELKKSLEELKSTQAQLIQREKMASLGELTAGIAHEIQNPLNFVNNFSDVNKELVEELQNELTTGNTEEAFAISNDIKENEQKINHHGKRADAIVKGMLEHSRASTGKKELTDINALADEYLRLSYHGLRAKDKDFNANFTTSFDESIGNIEVAPQDMGRVLLNLYNNAFYAVSQKKAQLNGTFEPTVEVATLKHADKIEIRVKDNGIGIPQKALDKIYQPFFTTKPTGHGTGLGLSLSYDIIKAHGGELKVESKEGEGAALIINLPLSNNVT